MQSSKRRRSSISSRRPGCPLKIASVDGTIYQEVKDFAELRDTRIGVTPWTGSFDVYHEPPRLVITAGSRIKTGDKLRASYYHAVTIYDNQVPCSLAEHVCSRFLQDQVERVEKLFHPETYMLSHDEIRVANWTEDELRPGRSSGDLLAENVGRCVSVVRGVNPQARLLLVRHVRPAPQCRKRLLSRQWRPGGLLGGFAERRNHRQLELRQAAREPALFRHARHRQVLAGSYDGRAHSIRDWLTAGEGLSGIDGYMYTTWQHNFRELEAFAGHAWGGKSQAVGNDSSSDRFIRAHP